MAAIEVMLDTEEEGYTPVNNNNNNKKRGTIVENNPFILSKLT